MSETCLDVRNLSKSFNGRKVVNNLSFSVERGRGFGLLGHNGTGCGSQKRGLENPATAKGKRAYDLSKS